MRARITPLFKVLGMLILVTLLVGISTAAMPHVKNWWKPAGIESRTPGESEASTSTQLINGDTIRLAPEVTESLGLRVVKAEPCTRPRSLPPLAGSLALDANRLARVHARFAGEVVEIGSINEERVDLSGSPTPAPRPIRFGDRVEKDQLLAVLWSKDLGEKKSELVEAISRLRLDQETLQRLEAGYQKGAIPERSVREAERNVESDQIALARAERTLRSWRLSEAEIEAIKAEGERLRLRKAQRDPEREKDWARVDVRAPFAGAVLEKNIAVGDIVDTSTDLYKVADLSKLSVWAHAYEEDLPAILALSRPIRWSIQLKSDPRLQPFPGTIDKIGDIIDPNQHTALILGQVDNAEGRLRAGQFIMATIEIPPSPDEVVIPTTALVEDGYDSIVFVQPDPAKPEFAMRRVVVARRQQNDVFVRSRVNPKEKPSASSEKRLPLSPIQPGERVVASGALELKAKVEDLRDTRK